MGGTGDTSNNAGKEVRPASSTSILRELSRDAKISTGNISAKEVTQSEICDPPMNLDKHSLKDRVNTFGMEVDFGEDPPMKYYSY